MYIFEIAYRKIQGSHEKNLTSFIIYHSFTIDLPCFGLNRHNQGTLLLKNFKLNFIVIPDDERLAESCWINSK
jgi:hypothetical protein